MRGLLCDRSAPTSWSSANRLRTFAADMRLGGQAGSSSDAHTTGIWDLIWGRADDAVADLREAVRREPSNARALNDLAVALTEYAQSHDDPSALIDAFVAADSAVRVGLDARGGAVHARGVARAVVSPDRRDWRVEPLSPDRRTRRVGRPKRESAWRRSSRETSNGSRSKCDCGTRSRALIHKLSNRSLPTIRRMRAMDSKGARRVGSGSRHWRYGRSSRESRHGSRARSAAVRNHR